MRFQTGIFQTMQLNYYPETDSLYNDLMSRPGAESREVSPRIVLNNDVEGSLVGIDLDNASQKLEIKELIVSKMPIAQQKFVA